MYSDMAMKRLFSLSPLARRCSGATALLAFFILLLLCPGCGTQRKLQRVRTQATRPAELALEDERAELQPQFTRAARVSDTISVDDGQGGRRILMRAIPDARGGMTPFEELDPVVVTARFRNLAERDGKVDIAFQVRVPAEMRDSRWQLRFYPDLHLPDGRQRLDPVIITGSDYRRSQLRGYEQYNRFLNRISADTTLHVDRHQLEVFIERNIPALYAFKRDSSFVSDELFVSSYGVTEQEAVEHYTLWTSIRRNRLLRDREKMYRRYVKVPIASDGVRLDTVLRDEHGYFVYHYTQPVAITPRIRKIDVTLSGGIYDTDDRLLYSFPAGDPLTFYISSLNALADSSDRYLTRVEERQMAVTSSHRIDFELGRADINPALGTNRATLSRIRRDIADLLSLGGGFALDSVMVDAFASPDGSVQRNDELSAQRGESVARWLGGCILSVRDSLYGVTGPVYDLSGRPAGPGAPVIRNVRSRGRGENWPLLDWYVDADPLLTADQKVRYASLQVVEDLDRRQALLTRESFYPYLFEQYYPRLRTVELTFHLKGTVPQRDTVRTDIVDETYASGVQALARMEYAQAARILAPYGDYNTALAYSALGRNAAAMAILSQLPASAEVLYLKAILHARLGQERDAVDCYLAACREDPAFVRRGNLDPEIRALIRLYNLQNE